MLVRQLMRTSQAIHSLHQAIDQTQSVVAGAYETAVTFRDEDQAVRNAEARIRQELRDRYDVEVLETGADPAVVRATLVDRDTERQAQVRGDEDLAADVEHAAELSWYSAERRELDVEGNNAGPDRAAAATAWKRADVAQARHPRESVQGGRKG